MNGKDCCVDVVVAGKKTNSQDVSSSQTLKIRRCN